MKLVPECSVKFVVLASGFAQEFSLSLTCGRMAWVNFNYFSMVVWGWRLMGSGEIGENIFLNRPEVKFTVVCSPQI